MLWHILCQLPNKGFGVSRFARLHHVVYQRNYLRLRVIALQQNGHQLLHQFRQIPLSDMLL